MTYKLILAVFALTLAMPALYAGHGRFDSSYYTQARHRKKHHRRHSKRHGPRRYRASQAPPIRAEHAWC